VALASKIEDARWREALTPAAKLVDAKRYAEAIKLYDKALEKGPSARAFAMRGYSYALLGQHAKAIEDYDRALELDPESSCCSGTRSNRARSYLHLKAVDKALVDLLEAAERDDAFAARELAMMYAFGRHGMKRDYVAARQWCERAAKQGDGLAMYCMGGILHAGLGAPKDAKGAARWFEGAAKRGVADAQADLAYMLWHGQGVAQDRPQAIAWWKAATRQGNKRAEQQLEGNLSAWEFFTEVTLPRWLEKLFAS
jgi:TPR repeat protein